MLFHLSVHKTFYGEQETFLKYRLNVTDVRIYVLHGFTIIEEFCFCQICSITFDHEYELFYLVSGVTEDSKVAAHVSLTSTLYRAK
jgi:hypothetical protein